MIHDDECDSKRVSVCDAHPIPNKNTSGCHGADIYVHCDNELFVYLSHNISDQAPYQYIGCFVDTKGDRALTDGPETRLTIEECRESCPEYRYFALQNGAGTTKGMCRCGNSLDDATQYGPSTDCDTAVGTGGVWANSLYENKWIDSWKQIGYFYNWGTTWSLSLDDVDEFTSLQFKCIDHGYIGGFIATIDYGGALYSTMDPISDSNFKIISDDIDASSLVLLMMHSQCLESGCCSTPTI